MFEATIAPVTPRVHSLCTGDVIPLEDQIQRLLDRGVPTTVRLEGDGRTFALQHLTVVMKDALADHRLQLHDESISVESATPIIVIDTDERRPCDVTLRLATWCRDDMIEYLLAKHPGECASVVGRIENREYQFAGGAPSVWRIILDRMAANSDLHGVEAILLDEIHHRAGNPAILEGVADSLLDSSQAFDSPSAIETHEFAAQLHRSVRRLLSHNDVRIAIETERFVQQLHGGVIGTSRLLSQRHTQARLNRVAERIAGDRKVEENLLRAFASGRSPEAPNCATLLARTKPDWRPRGEKLLLRGAYLNHVCWPDIQLVQADLQRTSFQAADLTGAQLQYAKIELTDFSEATLALAELGVSRSALSSLRTESTSLRTNEEGTQKKKRGNVMERVKQALSRRKTIRNPIYRSRFVASNLTQANLIHCDVRRCDFSHADLSGVDARHSGFTDCRFDDADLKDGDFTGCVLVNTSFQNANLDSADFTLAKFHRLSLEDMVAEQVCFQDAQMNEARLTGSVLRRCNLQSANLSMSRLALIDWEHCDLRGADLRGCNFHLGSTRCGLVGSPYPSHGTRTGFYTDEYDEQYFQNPEQIRKASLFGADLRGANIAGVDFYLVDLRQAKYDSGQETQLRSTGAILDE